MLRHLFVAVSTVMLTVAPATAQISNSSELDMPMTQVTRVSELALPLPLAQPEPEVVETEEQFPKVSDLLEEQIPVTPAQPSLEVVNKGTIKESSQTESEMVVPVQPLEPSRVRVSTTLEAPQPRLEPSRVKTVKPSWPILESSRAAPIQPIQEPSPVIERQPIANNVVPFNSKGRLVNQIGPSKPLEPSRVTARNNIVPFRQRVVNRVEPSQPVLQMTREQSFVVTPNIIHDVNLEHGNSSTPTLEPETALSLGRETRMTNQTGIAPTLETPESLNRDFGISYTGVTPETAFSLDRELSTPASPIKRTQNSTTQSRNTSVRSVSNRAIDLGGTVTVQQPQPVVVETQQQTKPEPKPRPKGNLSVGVSGIGGQAPVLETSAGIEYDGFSTTVSLNHPLDGQGQDTVGLATTLPISDRAKLTVKADQINIDPTISATVESKITEQLTASASFNNISRPDFNLELAAKYQINNHWSTNASFNVMTRQINTGVSYATGRGLEATVKVDSIAENPQLGVGLGIELSSSTKLELNASNINGDPTFSVKVTQSFSF
jgi:hypothetical protein